MLATMKKVNVTVRYATAGIFLKIGQERMLLLEVTKAELTLSWDKRMR